ncbi:MAG: PD40 domain-containing protein [Gemmatimonadetes bacterium]|nr:PD40 domain-containing protein [Gemmatimonadota bacterium]
MSIRTRTFGLLPVAVVATILVAQPALAQDADGWRTIEFETTEVTEADVALSPDGQSLVFTMLGHLFSLPVEGGTAEQLTFGPYYDSEPAFSPEGRRVAFVSDRDESDGNVFVLDLANQQITQITHEPWAARPAWSPDGEAIVYLSFMRERQGPAGFDFSVVRRVDLNGGPPETVSDQPQLTSSVFHLPDGRLAWAVLENTESSQVSTKIEVRSEDGVVSTLHVFEGIADRVVASPAGDGLYGRRYLSPPFRGSEDLLFVSLPDGTERRISRLSRLHYPRPRFAVSPDGQSLYHGQAGRLWKVELPGGAVEPVAFTARVRLEVRDLVAPAKSDLAVAGDARQPRSILNPRLAPDGRSLVFGAAGHLWQQPLEGGQARRLSQGSAFESEPVFSPDGTQLAFVHREKGKEEVRVFSFAGQETRTLASGSIYWDPSWSPDGRRVVFVERGGALGGASQCPCRVVAVTVEDGKREVLIGSRSQWSTRPHFSSDGQWLYFVASPSPRTLYRLRLGEEAEPEPLSQLTRRGITRALVSPDGTWVAFQRNLEIWLAPIGNAPIGDEDVRQFSPEGGDTFAFTPDGSALIYSAGNRVWRQPVNGGSRQEIPVRLILERPIPPPLLLRQVRVLDFDAGGFSRETSVFIERGRIEWIGSEQDLPPETVIVDADGRFAIPGLFDLHVHTPLGGASEDAYLGYGVTSVRDVGGWLAWLNALADRSEASGDPVPRYFFSGAHPEQAVPARPQYYGRVMLEGDEEARSYVRWLKEAGVSFIKVHPPISWPLQRAVAEEARRLNLPVVGHGVFPGEIIRSVTLGYWTLEHLINVHDDVHQMLAAAGTRATPTLALGGTTLLMRDEPERLADPKLRAFVPEWWMRKAPRATQRSPTRTVLAGRLASIQAAHAAGVSLQIGTDSQLGVRQLFYGAALHWELENFVQAGLSPLEVLRIATQQAAEAVGAEDELGTLEPGKLADIVLLDANPLEDIKNTQRIWRVIKGGWVFDPDELRPPRN